MKIDNLGWLDEAHRHPSPNVGGALAPSLIVMHYTAGWTGHSAVQSLSQEGRKVSAHFVIDRDGEITQLVACRRQAWHAGPSRYLGYHGLNAHSIGLEFVNIGWMRPSGDGKTALDPYGVVRNLSNLPGIEYTDFVRTAHPRVGSGELLWPTFTEAQLNAGQMITEAIIDTYTIQAILSHEEVDTRGWKTDPGPAFPMNRFRKLLQHDRDDYAPVYVVTASKLNVREGPSTGHEIVATLDRNAQVEVHGREGDWCLVSFDRPNGHDQGWVYATYLRLHPDERLVRARRVDR